MHFATTAAPAMLLSLSHEFYSPVNGTCRIRFPTHISLDISKYVERFADFTDSAASKVEESPGFHAKEIRGDRDRLSSNSNPVRLRSCDENADCHDY